MPKSQCFLPLKLGTFEEVRLKLAFWSFINKLKACFFELLKMFIYLSLFITIYLFIIIIIIKNEPNMNCSLLITILLK